MRYSSLELHWFSLALLYLLFLPGERERTAQANENLPPNIILFLADDQRADFLGCAGHPVLKTPNIDQLAAAGTRFVNMFVTTSICAASRASILTGLHERTHGYTFGTPPIRKMHSAKSYPAMLQAAGYRTGFVGKFGVQVEAGETPSMFEFFAPLSRNPYFKDLPDGTRRHVTEISGDKSIEFLRGCSAEQPFCLSVSFNASHAEDGDKINHFPWPKAMDGWYDDVATASPRLSDPRIFDSQPDFLKVSLNRQRWYWRWDTKDKYEQNARAYYRMISGIDRVIGRVLHELGELRLDQNTIVIYSADNGYYKGDRGFAGKWSHYEESLRVPLIIKDSRLGEDARGRELDCTALNIDLPATILDLAGVAIPPSYQGLSLVPWLESDVVTDWRTEFFCEHLMEADTRIPKYEGVRGQRYVYARYFEQKPAYEFLHDLEEDPDQLRNFASEASYSEVLEQMRRRCDDLRDEYGGGYGEEEAE